MVAVVVVEQLTPTTPELRRSLAGGFRTVWRNLRVNGPKFTFKMAKPNSDEIMIFSPST